MPMWYLNCVRLIVYFYWQWVPYPLASRAPGLVLCQHVSLAVASAALFPYTSAWWYTRSDSRRPRSDVCRRPPTEAAYR